MKISDLMVQSGVAFGTSGARGLSVKITDLVAYSYTKAFLQYLDCGKFELKDRTVAIAGDLRPSTPRIMTAAMQAAKLHGYAIINCGHIPSPALALFGITRKIPTVMVTGSHIPADRNGIKFTKISGEISKEDEQGILAQGVEIPADLFDDNEMLINPIQGVPIVEEARRLYLKRFLQNFPKTLLKGRRIGVYEHSAVGRELMLEIVTGLGGEALSLGRSKEFIPVDTEAIREEEIRLAKEWAHEHHLDAIISTDGDSDRPLISDENGSWFRGDLAGILTAQYLKCDAVVTPVSCNSAVEEVGFKKVYRTRIGSPYVIAGMEEAARDGWKRIVGYEANGGFLQYNDIEVEGGVLEALPTRDAIIVHLALLSLSAKLGIPLSKLREMLPPRFTASGRLKEFPFERSRECLKKLSGEESGRYPEIKRYFCELCGEVREVNFTDGLRITFINGEVIHLRTSGNAPEFRCYTEASLEDRAQEILEKVLVIMESWR